MGAKVSCERLTKEDLEFLSRNTHYQEDTISEWYRGFTRDCPDGRLRPADFMKIYTQWFPKGRTSHFCDHVFRTFDTDGNGFIDFKEFLFAIDVTSCGTPEQKLGWAFRLYDVDGNGWIDMREMTTLVKCIYTMLGLTKELEEQQETAWDKAKDIFIKMDKNADGKVTKEEFIQTCLVDQDLTELLTTNICESPELLS